MKKIAKKYPDINFLLLYVREAHPGNKTKTHETIGQKLANARRLRAVFDEERKIAVDDMNGRAHQLYGSLPNMIYVINTDGTVLFRGDWNNTEYLTSVLDSIATGQIFQREHFRLTKPTPILGLRALMQGGVIALWDFIVGFPKLIRLHKRADKAYEKVVTGS